jgi:hypothetical protein
VQILVGHSVRIRHAGCFPDERSCSPGSHAPTAGTLCGMKKLTQRQSRQLLWGGIALQLLMAIVGFAVGYYHSTHDKWILGAVGAAAGMIIFDILVWVVGIPVAMRLRRNQDQLS